MTEIVALAILVAVGLLVVMGYSELRYRRQRRETDSLAADMGLQYLRLEQRLAQAVSQEAWSTANRRIGERDRLAPMLESGAPPQSSTAVNVPTAGALIREINHSLNTPLAQIELSVVRARNEVAGAQSVMDSLAMCRAVLAAYRDVANVMEQANEWDVRDLGKTLTGAAQVFVESLGEGRIVNVRVESPTKPRTRLSNYYLLSLILPLLQNAVEAAPNGSDVICNVKNADKMLSVTLSNRVDKAPDLAKVRELGYSTRGEGHSGVGLTSVDTLTSRIDGGRLLLTCENSLFVAHVLLPGGSL